jgi:hypothetical protein
VQKKVTLQNEMQHMENQGVEPFDVAVSELVDAVPRSISAPACIG